MTDKNQTEEPKIIVDEDWKSQVEREKEELKNQDTASTPEEEAAADDFESMELPPASLQILLSTLATQAMGSLGLLPDPASGKPNVNRKLAKHFIDTMAMLEEKTKGNLTDEEATQLRDSLHQLRMIYLSTPNTPTAGSDKPSATEPKKPTIELP